MTLPGHSASSSEIDRLPDPQLFRDAVFLANNGAWSPVDLDDTDALLLALVKRLQTPPKRS